MPTSKPIVESWFQLPIVLWQCCGCNGPGVVLPFRRPADSWEKWTGFHTSKVISFRHDTTLRLRTVSLLLYFCIVTLHVLEGRRLVPGHGKVLTCNSHSLTQPFLSISSKNTFSCASVYTTSKCTLFREVNPWTVTEATVLTSSCFAWLQRLGGTCLEEYGTRGWHQMARWLQQFSIPLYCTAAHVIQAFCKCCHLSVWFPDAQHRPELQKYSH